MQIFNKKDKMYFELISASLVRLWLFSISDLVEWLKVRPELTTPNTSWERGTYLNCSL